MEHCHSCKAYQFRWNSQVQPCLVQYILVNIGICLLFGRHRCWILFFETITSPKKGIKLHHFFSCERFESYLLSSMGFPVKFWRIGSHVLPVCILPTSVFPPQFFEMGCFLFRGSLKFGMRRFLPYRGRSRNLLLDTISRQAWPSFRDENEVYLVQSKAIWGPPYPFVNSLMWEACRLFRNHSNLFSGLLGPWLCTCCSLEVDFLQHQIC